MVRATLRIVLPLLPPYTEALPGLGLKSSCERPGMGAAFSSLLPLTNMGPKIHFPLVAPMSLHYEAGLSEGRGRSGTLSFITKAHITAQADISWCLKSLQFSSPSVHF